MTVAGPPPSPGPAMSRLPLLRGETWAILAVYSFVLVLRAPDLLQEGRFWAEEGKVYFAYAWSHSWWETLLQAHLGYLSLYNNIAATLAELVPLERAPRVTAAMAALVQVTLALLIVASDSPPFEDGRRKAFGCAAVLLALPSQEVWLCTIHSQFFFAAAAAIVLIRPAAGGAFGAFGLAVVLLGGLTGPVTSFLTPLFLLRAWRERTSWRIAQASVLMGAALVQGALLASALAAAQRPTTLQPDALIAAMAVRGLVQPMLGSQASDSLLRQALGGNVAAWSLMAVAGTALALAGLRLLATARQSATAWLFAAACLTMLMSLAGALGNDRWRLLEAWEGGRYVFAANALVLLAIAVAATEPQRRRWAMLPLLWLLAVGALDYLQTFAPGPSWRAEVKAWRQDAGHALAIWPPGWFMTLPAR